MDTIANIKEQTVTETPILLLDIELIGGTSLRWCTHGVTVDAEIYSPRVLRHNFFEVQAASDHGIDAIPKITFTLANADSLLSQIETAVGFKGAQLRARFVFYDLVANEAASESIVVFQGFLNPPDEITEASVRLSAVNRMNMQRVLLPPVRIQSRCPWEFPSNAEERQEAGNGGTEGTFSRFFRCGYSADQVGGTGNLDGALPFTTCNFTRSDCTARGMFSTDSSSNATRRFGGIEFVPPTVQVRSHGQRGQHDAATVSNEARYNDFVPLIYGTSWIEPPIVFARNDGNLTRMEILLGLGKINQVVKVLVNNIDIPLGITGQDMTGSGWWNLFADGDRHGGFNLNFVSFGGVPQGDPYGSMVALSVVVPNQINDGRVLPCVKVLLEGLRLDTFDSGGGALGQTFSDNPAWILLDVLRRSGWRRDEIDLPSFADAAAFCDETIAATDNQGNGISVKRFRCNLLLRSRRTAADVIRGIRNNARLQLTYTGEGKIAVRVDNSLALQQPSIPAGSNATAQVNGGWPAYVYTDGSTPGMASAILRKSNDEPAVRLWHRPTADTPNRFFIEFADEFNELQQDSLALLDSADIARTGQEIAGRLVADGLPTFDQAARILKFFLDKSIQGNKYIEFETGVKALGQKVGDIITVTYVREGLIGQPFRILKLQPSTNYRQVRITAQIHNDAWYQDTNGQLSLLPPTRRQPESEQGVPDPLYGDEFDEFGEEHFSITEFQITSSDGSILTEVEVGFKPPDVGQSLVAGIPLVSLQPNVQSPGGSIEGGQTLYYAVSATDSDGRESNPSFVVRATVPAGGSSYQIELTGLSFTAGAASFSVYRGPLPTRLFRIASGQAIAGSFTDTGLTAELTGAPDPRYDHANFYWRLEDTDEFFASDFGPDSVGSSLLNMTVDAFIGHSVRLLRGKGAGQERIIANNTATTVFVTSPWVVEPDESTIFVVSENTWHFGGRARSSPARFLVPNRGGQVIQITGRAANAQNIESLEGLALITRHRIGGGGLGVADSDVPPEPAFAVTVRGDGTLQFSPLAFPVLENTQSITTGTFQLYYRDELAGSGTILLAAAISDTDTSLTLTAAGSAIADDLIQVEGEILKVTQVTGGGTQYDVERGQCNSTAQSHAVNTPVYTLHERTVIAPFEKAFFGTTASGGWVRIEQIPNIRLACGELWVTNTFGRSPTTTNNYSMLPDGGLRTLRGGQFNFQVEGGLAVLANAVPTVSVQEPLSIRDVYAVVKQAPVGASIDLQINQDGSPLTTLTVAAGQTNSNVVNGAELPVLQSLANLTLDIVAVGTTFPGSDLTVTIRV
ncbi:MAG: hypothetical protein O2968_04085 [Acidobacteria bacterium]|nr:hypothetical protein [Acidobacteriota bacterium]